MERKDGRPAGCRIGNRVRRAGFWGALAALLCAGGTVQAAQIEEVFAILDANGDGGIDAQEFQLRKTEVFFRSIRNMDAGMTLAPADTNLTPEAFADADTNRDGQLSGAEFVLARFSQFELYDTDDDRVIDLAEFEAFARQFARD